MSQEMTGEEREKGAEGGDSDIRDEVSSIVRDGKDIARRITEVIHRAICQGGGALTALPKVLLAVFEGSMKGVVAVAPGEQRERLEAVLGQLEEVMVSVLTAFQFTVREAIGRGDQVAGQEIRDFASELFSLTQLFGEIVSKYAGQLSQEARVEVSDIRMHLARIAMKVMPLVQSLLQAAIEIPQEVAVQAASKTGSLLASALRRAAERLDPQPPN
jgi:hypothetical protein